MPAPLHVRAVNTAPDSENKIHDNASAAAYGFRGGLVPGVTVYGYMAAAALEFFGPEWLEHGAMDVRLFKPVYDGDDLTVTLEPGADGHARIAVGESAGAGAWIDVGQTAWSARDPLVAPLPKRIPSRETLAPGTRLGSIARPLDLSQSRIAAPLDPFLGPDRQAHPAVLLSLANEILMSNYELGPWMHTASEVRKFSSVRDGEPIRVEARIEDRFEKKGHEFVVLDVAILGENRVIEQVRHTAIWLPRKL